MRLDVLRKAPLLLHVLPGLAGRGGDKQRAGSDQNGLIPGCFQGPL